VTVLDAGGTPKANPDFSEYGSPWTFTGRRLDPETGLLYFRNRYYQPGLGRFVGRDPIEYEAGSFSLYEYCQSAPDDLVDSSGLKWRYLKKRSSGNPTATIEGDQGDVVSNIARDLLAAGDLFQLNPQESELWLAPPRRPDYIVTGNQDCRYEIPNTVLLLFFGEAGKGGRYGVGLGTEKSQLKRDGYMVEEYFLGDIDKRIARALGKKEKDLTADDIGQDLLAKVGALSRAKHLWGWFSWSHGTATEMGGPFGEGVKFWPGWADPPDKYKNIRVRWTDIGAQLQYGLAFAVVHACESFGKGTMAKESLLKGNPNGKFWGHSGEWRPRPAFRVRGIDPGSFGGNWGDLKKRQPAGGDLNAPP
jgi:RHS repeat-associated protein